MTFRIGMEVNGIVTGVQPYGAFISLDDKTQGLIHISEVKHGFIKSIADVLAVNDEVKVKIIDIDEYSQKISLSMRALDPKAPISPYKRKTYFTNRKKKIGFETLEEQLPVWVQESMKELTGK
ncbi:CvfD/Ygs/GSP13 family RNA-binding post-transcriptional regulator [Vagococcus intermedius]|uniref:CvfD/Ygs/GSP13 family RNA-binding post-transcriptional regulator n=1 Tax=Vagococcus intermedius TaxID=2991418 RepID=A0AAF0CU53_9ENTE|nr:CvfD/Ygs/GSP13 family RNA-binding post-transcriptional regulator [Vagococcus intermedius]WEG72911.1 CvfD/Ygs/GSP13 family RNA-binding post-transcriptional regulator [Vagococcus intermedius]WEG74998.1 CvfD/Ygs/GSP13 family RNA-binding post-transcriptional regulator [Vagococcus intermedius]